MPHNGLHCSSSGCELTLAPKECVPLIVVARGAGKGLLGHFSAAAAGYVVHDVNIPCDAVCLDVVLCSGWMLYVSRHELVVQLRCVSSTLGLSLPTISGLASIAS